MEYFNQNSKEYMIRLFFKTIFKKIILICFFFNNSLVFAQSHNLVFKDLGNGNLHKYWEKYTPNQKLTSNTVLDQLNKDKILSLNDSLGLISAKTSHNVTHNKFQQFYDGFPVEGAYFSFHSINGNLIAFNGTLVSSLLKYDTVSVIKSSKAVDIAMLSIGATKYAWEDKAYIALISEVKGVESFSVKPKPILTLYNKENKYLLAYKMEIHSLEPLGRYTVYIDANTGNMIEMFDNLHHANSSGTCSTVYHGSQSVDFDLNGSNYELTDKLGATNRNLETYLLPNNSVNYSSATIPSMPSSGSVLDCFNLVSNFDKAALDIHWATSVTYDFFEILGINSFDNNGTQIRSFTNYGDDNSSKNNAFWNGIFLTYGAGGGSPFPGPVATLDVVAHEFGHALTEEYGGGLLYQGESGAINESISDMITASVENATIANNATYSGLTSSSSQWVISQLNGGGIRSMSNPNLFSQPNTYYGTFWASTSGPDHGGVHTNSAVGNYWFYLLANSLGSNGNQVNDNGDTYNVTSIGFDDALAIVLESYNYLTFTSNYLDFRNATILAAQVLFNDLRVCEVINAWDAVGVGMAGESCTVQSGIAYTQTQFCTAQAMSFSNSFVQNVNYNYSWTFNGVTTAGYYFSMNAPAVAGVYPLIQTVTEIVSGDFITNQIDLYIDVCSPIDTTAHNAHWYFGSQQGFDFSNGIAQISSFPYRNFEKGTNFSIGNDLKYYVASNLTEDTMNLYDSSDSILANLSPLFCSSRRIGSSAPDANNEFINVFLSSSSQGGQGLYRLTLQIDVSGNVIYDNLSPVTGPSNFTTDANSAIQTRESIAIIPGCNSSVFWLIAPLYLPNGNGVLVYKLDYSITSSAFSNYGDLTLVHQYSPSQANGAASATSPDGRFVALGNRIYEFDRSSGALTTFAYLPQSGFGCFSANSNYYYQSGFVDAQIYQYDLNASNVSASLTLVAEFPSFLNLNDLELGPDGKIYVSSTGGSNGNTYNMGLSLYNANIGVINNPNVKEVNGSTMFNSNAYFLYDGSIGVTLFPDFTETFTVNDNPLSLFYTQENCNTFNFSAPDCLPNYTWDFGDGTVLTNSNQDEVTHTFAGTGPYIVSITSTINGNLTTITETIDFGIDASGLEIIGPNSTCEVNTYFSGPAGFKEYSWSIISGSATVNNTSSQQTNVTNSGGNFTIQLILTDYFDCTAILTKTVTVGSPPNITIVSSICKTGGTCNGEVLFEITGGLAPYSYSVGNTYSGTSNNQVLISNLCVNSYSINITDANGCEAFKFQALNCGVVLPIELLSFNAEMNENKTVSLFWETHTEVNNDYFTVERSVDGIHWKFVVKVDGVGNTNESINYNAIDLKRVEGVVYYRLKQTNFDSNYSFSNIITLNNLGENGGFVVVFPNPTDNVINIKLNSETIEDIKIYNILGKEVSSEILILSQTNNKVVLDLSNLLNGIYYLKVNNFNTKVVKKDN